MLTKSKAMFMLGAGGFIGREVVKEAVRQGWQVKALVRSERRRAELEALGAVCVPGDAQRPTEWIAEVRGASALVDLVQPELPGRIGLAAIQRIAQERLATTRATLAALETLAPGKRPLYVSISGVDDLAPDARGLMSHASPLRTEPVGFAHIGLPVRRLIERASLEATFVYLGTVYGPGKAFGERVLPGLAKGRHPIIGRGENRVAMVHVVDAARALVHLVGLPRASVVGRTFVAADGARTTQRQMLEYAAGLLGGPAPRRVPAWLVSLAAGRILVEVLERDTPTDPSALLESGFRFRYPSIQTGIPATIEALGLGRKAGPAQAMAEGAR